MNLLEHTTDEEIWQESYWAFRNNLMNCATINSPIQKLLQPSQVQVRSFFSFHCMLKNMMNLQIIIVSTGIQFYKK